MYEVTHRKRNKKAQNRGVQIRVFVCPECGTHITATKSRGQTHPGHIKDIWCYVCQQVQKCEQIE